MCNDTVTTCHGGETPDLYAAVEKAKNQHGTMV